MDRQDVTELHYIVALMNLASLLEHGILSHASAEAVQHVSVASADVQARRAERRIPGGLRLHQYVNLYFNARNAMLFRIVSNYDAREQVSPEDLVILRVSPAVLDDTGVVLTDINAAAAIEPRWHTVAEGLPLLNHAAIHATYWEDRGHRQRMMAEVLVPRAVRRDEIMGAYVVSDQVAEVVSRVAPTLAREINPYMFFRGGRR